MNRHAQGLKNMLTPIVEAMDYEFVGCELFSYGRKKCVRLFIDKPQGVDVEDCAKVSRQVSSVLNVEEPISGEYRLEVSSPGLDRPLFEIKHYQNCVGAKIKLKTYEAIDGRKNYTGIVNKVTEDAVVLVLEEQEIELAFSNIAKANVVPDFDVL